ncbi:MAG: hypothetical protein WCH61_10675, partial [bacterium]
MLVAMALAAVLYLGWTYLIGPLRTDQRRIEGELAKTRKIYTENQRLVSTSRGTQKRYDTERTAFLKIMR